MCSECFFLRYSYGTIIESFYNLLIVFCFFLSDGYCQFVCKFTKNFTYYTNQMCTLGHFCM